MLPPLAFKQMGRLALRELSVPSEGCRKKQTGGLRAVPGPGAEIAPHPTELPTLRKKWGGSEVVQTLPGPSVPCRRLHFQTVVSREEETFGRHKPQSWRDLSDPSGENL